MTESTTPLVDAAFAILEEIRLKKKETAKQAAEVMLHENQGSPT